MIILTPQIVYNKLDADIDQADRIVAHELDACRTWSNCTATCGLRSRCDQWNDNETEAVYPTYVPKEGEMLPTMPEQNAPASGPVLQQPPHQPTPSPGNFSPGSAQPLPIPPQQPVQPPMQPMNYYNQSQGGAAPVPAPYGNGPQPVSQVGYVAAPTRLPQSTPTR